MMPKDAKLVLKDGSVFEGKLFGSEGTPGEVVFTTGMSGYQEVISDPSFAGQIVVLTYPLIGNYGTRKVRNQGNSIALQAVIASEVFEMPNHWESEGNLVTYLEEQNIPLFTGCDTRALTKKIRSAGAMQGVIVSAEVSDQDAMKKIIEHHVIDHPAHRVTCKKKYEFSTGKYKVAVVDFGIKKAILESLKDFDLALTVYPASTKAEEILQGNPDGIFLSNGPGDPKLLLDEIQMVKELVGKTPIFGICLGHQLLALAAGADTYKMKFGHRGSNQPVKELRTGRIHITSQNHGYVIKENSIPSDWEVTHLSMNDETIEGIRHKTLPVFSVQYHPEAQAGPLDNQYLFNEFVQLMEQGGGK